jgi:Fuc2NAc and GlcNAc transferase
MIYFLFFIFSVILTYLIRIYTLKKSILDIPNARSSHSIPTPRGGGLAIILSFYAGLFYFKESLGLDVFYALLCVTPIVLISLLDDIYTLSASIRIFVQSLAIVMALYSLGGVSHIDFYFFSLQGQWLNIFAFLTIFWISNLYNFLDGIDGYAGSQTVAMGIGFFLFLHNPLALVLVFSALGFLVFNWHKASIFMGDVGSVSLGFIFAILMFSETNHNSFLLGLMFLSLFWIDASLTLFGRYRRGKKLTEAHKEHSYQKLNQLGWSPSKISSFALLFNLFFILLIYFWTHFIILFLVNILLVSAMIYTIDKQKSS